MTTATGGSRRAALVTGAAGFIGSALCQRLLAAGYRVIGYDNLSRGRREYLPPGVTLVEGDVRDGARLDETLLTTQPDCVIHLAAMHFIPECIAEPQKTMDVNVAGTQQVLDSCRTASIQRFIFASSAAVYAPTEGPCVEDTTPLRPLEVYGESKVAAERLAAAFQADTGISTCALRMFNAVGRRETNPHVIPHIFESVKRSDEIPLGNVEPRRDYIDTRDVAEAILAVLDGPAGFQVLNVGTGVAHSVSDIVAALRRILGRPITIVPEPSRARASDRLLLLADVEKMRHASRWTARITLEESLEDLVTAYGL